MVFSCLVDADYRDTEAYYDRLEDRDWRGLPDLLPHLTAAFDVHMAGCPADRDLNRLRAGLLGHIRSKATLPPGLFTLSVPTGGGKTLALMGFALDHAALQGHRRIIYTIHTSIIDQTAAIFRGLFGDAVLEHHSAIEDEKPNQPEGRDKLRLAMEDWQPPSLSPPMCNCLKACSSPTPRAASSCWTRRNASLGVEQNNGWEWRAP